MRQLQLSGVLESPLQVFSVNADSSAGKKVFWKTLPCTNSGIRSPLTVLVISILVAWRRKQRTGEAAKEEVILSNGDAHEIKGKAVLIDLSYLIHRSYKTGGDSPPVFPHEDSATNIVLRTVLRLERDLEPSEMIFALEHGYDHRTEIYSDYKSGRDEKDDALVSEIDRTIEILVERNYRAAYAKGLEADDVMATIAFESGFDSVIVTADKDLHQLADHCNIYDPYKRVEIKAKDIFERWGIQPHQLGDCLAMQGDKADSIPGISGIGPKKSAALIKEHGSLRNILKAAEGKVTKKKVGSMWQSLYDNRDVAGMSRKLVQLIVDADIEYATLEQMPWSIFKETT